MGFIIHSNIGCNNNRRGRKDQLFEFYIFAKTRLQTQQVSVKRQLIFFQL